MKLRILICIGLICLLSVTVYAQGQNKLKPFLIDLTGWKAEQAEGMAMEMGPMKVVNANRQYEKGDATLSALLMVGSNAMAQGQFGNFTMNIDNEETKVIVTKIQGFKVTHSYDKKEKSGSFMVFLAQKADNGGIFGVTYEGITMDEAEIIAKKYDWKKMKATVEKLL